MTAQQSEPAELSAILRQLAQTPVRDRAAFLQKQVDPGGDAGDFLRVLIGFLEGQMLSDLPAALAGASAVVETADAVEDPASRLRARRVKAQCLSYANRFGEALAALDEAASIARPLELRREHALVNLTRLHALARLGRLDEAVEAGISARQDLLEEGESMAAAKADVNLGVVERMRDRPADALAHFDRAMPLFVDEPMIAAQIESNRAEALLDLHDFDGAEAAFRRALALFEQIDARRGAAIVEGNLADLMGRQGRLAAALQHFERARRRIEEEGSPGDAARLAGEVAEVQLELGMPDEAARASDEAAAVLERQGMIAEAARVRITRGRALALLHQTEEAEKVLLQAAAEFERAQQPQRKARAVLARAELLIAGHATTRAEEARGLIMSVFPALRERPADAALAHAMLAAIELQAGRARQALDETDAGLDLAARLGLGPLRGDLLHLRGLALAQLGTMEEAVQALEDAAANIEHIRGSLQADRFRTAFHARRASVYGDAVAAVLQMHDGRQVARAFGLVERSRSRALLDLMSRGGEAPLPDAGEGPEASELSQDLARWRSRLNALYTALHESGGVQRHHARSWQDEIGEAERQITRIESRLASATRLGGVYAEPVPLDQVKASIPEDSALLEYFIAGDRLLIFIVQHRLPPKVLELGNFADVLPLLRRFRFHLSGALMRRAAGADASSSSGKIDRELAELHRLLLEPVLGELDGPARLIIAPHGPLHALPFHALRDGASYLIERFEVLSIPSASVLTQLAGQVLEPGEGRPLLIAVSDERAPAIEQEVDALAEILPDARQLRGSDATIEAVMHETGGSPLVHISTHGIFTNFAPESSGVRLADGWLTAREAARMRLDGAVVTLSGCETGRSAATAGDELQGLVRALLAAGARSVLGSLWSVHDASATELLVSTYRRWYLQGWGGGASTGRTLASALREAQIEQIRRGVSPAYWAPFFLVGTP